MRGQRTDTQRRKWAQGLDDPEGVWVSAMKGAPGEVETSMLGSLVNAISDLTGRWLHYDARREAD